MSVKGIVLAAGQGTRMKSRLPKAAHEIAGRALVSWVCDALIDAGVTEIVAVVGYGASEVTAALPSGVATVEQAERLGTGDAARIGFAALDSDPADTVLIVPGDMPLIRGSSLTELITAHSESGAAGGVLTASVADPTGYGRIQRDPSGAVTGIVEERDATPEERTIAEVSTGVFVFESGVLGPLLAAITPDNDQNEYYLPDVVGMAARAGSRLVALPASEEEMFGVNSHAQLAAAAAVMRGRINRRWMDDGVWMLDPDRVYLDAGVELAAGVRLYPGTHLEGATRVAAGAEVGPDVFARDSVIGEGARVWYAVLRGAAVGARAEVGPYASLRPGADLHESAKAGTFVEIKKSVVGPRSKVPHLSYIGDATLDEDVNIGAGTITCNYDGYAKHETIIGARVRTGSATMLVAPLEIGDDGWTGAGSVITQDVPPGALAVERSTQRVIAGYAEKRRRREQESER